MCRQSADHSSWFFQRWVQRWRLHVIGERLGAPWRCQAARHLGIQLLAHIVAKIEDKQEDFEQHVKRG